MTIPAKVHRDQSNIKIRTKPLLAAMILSVLATGTANAATDKLKLKYDFYGSKFRVLSASFDISFDASTYVVKSIAKTKGVASMFAKAKFHHGARGKITSNNVFPEEFQTRYEKGKKSKSAHILWQGKSNPRVNIAPKLNRSKQASIDSALKPSYPDPLSALLNIAFSPKKPCTKSITTFDGRKISKFKLKYLGKDTLAKGNAGAYAGPAYKCSFRNIPVAGFSHKKMKAHRHKPASAFTMWFAPLKSTATGKAFYVPVKIEGSINATSITGILASGKFNGLALSAHKQTANASSAN